MASGGRRVPLHFRVTEEFFADLTNMTDELDAQSRAEVTRCALQLLHHVRGLFKRGGKLLQEEDGILKELLPNYIKKNGRRALLSTGDELIQLSDEDRNFFEDIGIDPE